MTDLQVSYSLVCRCTAFLSANAFYSLSADVVLSHLQMRRCTICRPSACLSADFDVDLQILWFVVCISVLCFTPFADALLVSLQISGVLDLQKLHNLICSFTGM